MNGAGQRVAVIGGGSQGIGAGAVDISQPVTAQRVIDAALGHIGRVDGLVNNVGVFVSKPFTDYVDRGQIADH